MCLCEVTKKCFSSTKARHAKKRGGKRRSWRGDKGAKRERHVLVAPRLSSISSDEDEPAPSPSAAVVARRASREAKSMREESGSDEDAEEPEDWEDDGEASSEEDESDEEARVKEVEG